MAEMPRRMKNVEIVHEEILDGAPMLFIASLLSRTFDGLREQHGPDFKIDWKTFSISFRDAQILNKDWPDYLEAVVDFIGTPPPETDAQILNTAMANAARERARHGD